MKADEFICTLLLTKETHLRHLSLSKHLFAKYAKGTVLRITQMNNFKLKIGSSNPAAVNDLVQCVDH